MSVVSPLTTNI